MAPSTRPWRPESLSFGGATRGIAQTWHQAELAPLVPILSTDADSLSTG